MTGRPKISKTPMSERLTLARELGDYPDDTQFAEHFSVGEQALRKWERGDRTPSLENLQVYRDLLGVSIDWLVSGEGKMLLDKNKISTNDNLHVPELFSYIPHYDVRVSAGTGMQAISEEVVSQIAFHQHWLVEVGLDPENAGVVVASGDSMEPTILDGTVMVVDFSQIEPVNGRIYVVNIGDELVVKRLERTREDKINLISDNTRYSTWHVDLSEFADMKIIGAVRFILKDM